MKKVISLLLVFVLIFAMAACGDSGGSAEAELLAELLQLAQENVRGVDACRAGADYSNTKFISFSHAL